MFFITACIFLFVVPFWLIVSISLTDEKAIASMGYRFIPPVFSLLSYKFVFSNATQIVDSYLVTALASAIGTALSLITMALCAYPLSRPNFIFRKQITFYIFFTMIFSGGLVPSYILNAKYLHLKDSFLIYILPGLCNAFYLFIIRTYFRELPASLIESAKIDGAGELKIFLGIILPLSKPVLATVSFFLVLNYWNNWFTCMLYITNKKLYTLQYLLQKILMELQFLRNLAIEVPVGSADTELAPTEGMRYAMAIVATGPMLIIFPFFQKYFTQGLTIGAIKG